MLVFIDANIYIATRYVFDRVHFATLQDLIKENKVNLLYTTATEGEVLQHIRKDISGAVDAYNRTLKKEAKYLLNQGSFKLSKIDKTEAIKLVESKFNEFISLNNVHLIPLNPLNAEELMDDYFKQNPPFESKKPSEFKDAIIINALKKYQDSTGQEICIVSNDEGFRKAFEGDDHFETFDKISAFLDYSQKQEKYYAALEEFIASKVVNGEFNDDIKAYLETFDISRGNYRKWECIDHSIDDIECELSFIDIKGEGVIAYVDVTVNVDAEIRYRDEDSSYYDTEEGRYLFEKYVTVDELHQLIVEIAIKCDICKDEDNIDCDVYNDGDDIELIDFSLVEDDTYPTLDLDNETMIGYDEIDSEDESETEDHGIIRCSECGKMIGKESNVAGYDYEGNPLCEDCMVSDGRGEICPICGNKYPHDFMMSGFCENCARNLD